MKLAKKINSKLFHQQLKHVRMLRHVMKAVKDVEIEDELSENCKICMCAQKTRLQNHEIVKSASELAEHLHIDF